MVLQRETPLPIWGWADPGEQVTVTFRDTTMTATADAGGNWGVKLPPVPASNSPSIMTISGKNTIKLLNILIGEVWVGSGQSNMQWPVSAATNAAEEMVAANYPQIRLFLVPLVPSGTPAKTVNAHWTPCSPRAVPEFSAVLYFFGRELHKRLDVPIGLISTSWGGTRIEPWIPPEGLSSLKELKSEWDAVAQAESSYQAVRAGHLKAIRAWMEAAESAAASGQDFLDPPEFPIHPLNSSGKATGLYNGMIHPLVPFAIRGAIWYQGEANRGQGMHYLDLMRGLIQGWRSVWGEGEFPFLYVQLAPFRYPLSETVLPEIWEAQTAALSIPNTGMAVTTDIATIENIHPTNKQEVGRRLSLWALAKTYGQDLVYSGPLYDSMTVEGDKIRIKFKYAGGGLLARDGKPLTWFSIAGSDKQFCPAAATIEGDTVLVQSPKVGMPVAVRFGWNQIAEPNLCSKTGLPASPFRTDQWADATNAPVATP
jgi:sialate O-acetylesterase